jgi:hypothetical protein
MTHETANTWSLLTYKVALLPGHGSSLGSGVVVEVENSGIFVTHQSPRTACSVVLSL